MTEWNRALLNALRRREYKVSLDVCGFLGKIAFINFFPAGHAERPPAGFCYVGEATLPPQPASVRAVTFFDGQNLFHSAKLAFGHRFPNYDPIALSKALCRSKGWDLVEARFYTGVPDAADNAFWNHFWVAKGAQMGREGVCVFTRPLRYRNKEVRLPDGSIHTFLDGDEKGIDVRIALDVISLAHSRSYDVAVLFCRDQDLTELADEVRTISREQNRWIKVASAYPVSPAVRFRGIDRTEWCPIDRATYDACLDTRDYRPKKPTP